MILWVNWKVHIIIFTLDINEKVKHEIWDSKFSVLSECQFAKSHQIILIKVELLFLLFITA